MKASLICTFLLLATATRIQKANGASSVEKQLRDAAKDNYMDLVKSLLERGVDAKATDKYGNSALMWAVLYGTAQMVEILLPESDVKAANSKRDTALDLAKARGSNQIVRLLQQYN